MKKLCVALALVMSFALPSASLGAPTIVKANQFNDWSPMKVVIKKLGKVKWTNPTTDGHHEIRSYGYRGSANVGSNWLSRQSLHPGTSVTKRFRKVGKYFYRCPIHSVMQSGECTGMCGKVIVKS